MKILVAIDGSKNALRALKYATRLVGRLSEPSELLLVNAHDDIALRGAGQFVGKDAVRGYLEDLSRDELKDAVAAAEKSKVAFSTKSVRGPIAQAIAAAARDEDCDLIVLGSKGRSAIKDLLIGSVAQRVAALAEVPVTLVK
ncbi:MAG TPA: universal stress protein [Burkholderiaceae bacterium]|nr:universal stress protein [Burkholderiaceae bacterium]